MDIPETEYMTTCPQCLAGVISQIVEGLFWKRMQTKTKTHEMLDMKIIDQGLFFKIEITKCSSQCPDLKHLLTISIKAELISTVKKENIVARLEQKLKNGYQASNVIYSTKASSFTLVPLDEDEPMNEFSSFKRYATIKLMFQVQSSHFDEFFSLMVECAGRIQRVDSNIKFTIRRGDDCLYKNRVQMDDSVMCCKIVTAACANIFKNIQDSSIQEIIKERLEMENTRDFEDSFRSRLLGYLIKCVLRKIRKSQRQVMTDMLPSHPISHFRS